MSLRTRDTWQLTHAQVRALLVGATSGLLAVLLRRPELMVFAVPFVAVTVWGVLTRPTDLPTARAVLSLATVREVESTGLRIGVHPVRHQDSVAVSSATARWVRTMPEHGTSVALVTGGATSEHALGVVADRWGPREAGPVLVAGASPWGAFRWGPVSLPALELTALPQPAVFDSSAPAPHPRGVVGLHRSVRRGDGSEFATIREFQWGDRLKRIHWARSLRSGTLHVTTTHADQDTHVAVVLDAHYDLGRSEGLTGRPSSLDLSVRAAAAVAEHFLHQGDRVSVRVLSSRTPLQVPVGTGRKHLLRILHVLSTVRPGPREDSDPVRLRTGLRAGTLVVVVSALVSPDVVAQAAALARSGLSVVVVDTLAADVQPQDDEALALLAWRIRLLEREEEIHRLRGRGVPVVAWRGPGSLDDVLRRMTARPAGGAA